ncbi:MAG: hypothetical protein EPN84_06300 [Legionella sp.]|nr:MAG: hypothetical protein EPN84_06300 [Legionella sp.]
MKKLGCVVLAGLVLSGCAGRYSSSGEQKYMQSRNGAKVQVPYPLTTDNMSNFYDLPPQNQDPRVNIAPPR